MLLNSPTRNYELKAMCTNKFTQCHSSCRFWYNTWHPHPQNSSMSVTYFLDLLTIKSILFLSYIIHRHAILFNLSLADVTMKRKKIEECIFSLPIVHIERKQTRQNQQTCDMWNKLQRRRILCTHLSRRMMSYLRQTS